MFLHPPGKILPVPPPIHAQDVPKAPTDSGTPDKTIAARNVYILALLNNPFKGNHGNNKQII